MNLRPLEYLDLQQIVNERLKCPETLRTALMINRSHQDEWYKREIANRDSRTRYFIFAKEKSVAYGGLEHIDWENSNAEISLLVYEAERGKGYGEQCIWEILRMGFDRLNLHAIYGECYACGNIDFWKKVNTRIRENTDGWKDVTVHETYLPHRKYWQGKYWDSYFFTYQKVGI
jgi:hypothetical protein